jgi:hypothetical protein
MRNAIELLIMHHENMRSLYPDEKLMVVCECEGVLYETRALALHALRSFDRVHDTGFFKQVTIDDLPAPLPDIDDLLYQLTIPVGISLDIARWYSRHLWDMDGVWYAHRPLSNIMKILRCLQAQDRTHVALCAERCGRGDEAFRALVNALGTSARMHFDDEMLYCDDALPGEHASERIIRACAHFQRLGYRLIAIIDNRADMKLTNICSIDEAMEVLFLQAPAVREMKRMDVPLWAAINPDFNLWDLLRTAECERRPVAGTNASPDCREIYSDGVW